MLRRLTLFFFCLSVPFLAASQNGSSDASLYREIFVMDSLLFSAFNNQDIAPIKQIFDEGLEFYHDKSGLTGYQQNIEQLRQNFERGNSPSRELVPGTLEVYPVPGYGAVQYGSHRFCHPENGEIICGTFKFVHVWKKTDQGWRLARVVSFDH